MDTCEPNPSGTYHERLLAFRRALIRDTILAAGGNKSRAARVLGLQRTYLLRLVRDLDLRDALRSGGRSPRIVALDARLSSSEACSTTRAATPPGAPRPGPAR
jgi:Bacterial regulatory protein, Fis family